MRHRPHGDRQLTFGVGLLDGRLAGLGSGCSARRLATSPVTLTAAAAFRPPPASPSTSSRREFETERVDTASAGGWKAPSRDPGSDTALDVRATLPTPLTRTDHRATHIAAGRKSETHDERAGECRVLAQAELRVAVHEIWSPLPDEVLHRRVVDSMCLLGRCRSRCRSRPT